MRLRNLFTLISLAGLGILFFMLAPQARAQDAGDPERGAELFATNCAVCHGEHGEGRVGATLNDVFVSMNADVALRQVISQGRPGTFMPTWGEAYGGPLTDQDISDIIAYIESWGTTYEPPVPAPPVPEQDIPPAAEVTGDPNVGYTIFQQNCAACHGEGGEGRIGATLTDTFPAINPGAYAVGTISRGVAGSLMPAWSEEYGGPLSDEEINDVAAYVLSIQSETTPRAGEQVLAGSALPLVIIGVLVVVLIVALAVAVNRREAQK